MRLAEAEDLKVSEMALTGAGFSLCLRRHVVFGLAMGQNPIFAVDIPIPTKID